MERLTQRTKDGIVGNNNGVENFPLYSLYDETHLDHGLIEQCFNKLAEYEDLEEQGLLLRLPCPIGTTVYFVEKRCNADSAACYGGCEKCADYSISSTIFDFDMISHVGNFYFLTKEEAEQALARMENG